jgi:SLT domain-containing protein
MSVKRREAILASASTLPFALALADKGWRKALKDDPNRRAGREHIGRATGLRLTRAIQPGARIGENKRKQTKIKESKIAFFYFLLLAFIFLNRDFSMRYGRFKQKISPSAGCNRRAKIRGANLRCSGAEFSGDPVIIADIIAPASALRKKMSMEALLKTATQRPVASGMTRPLVDKPWEPVRIDDLNRAIPSPNQTAALEGFQ